MHLIIISILLSGANPSSFATIPDAAHTESLKNGLIRTGNAFSSLLDEKENDSPLAKCLNQYQKPRLFSNSCGDLVATLRKRMNLMVLESDLQIQNEKLNHQPSTEKDSQKIAWLSKINLFATQAEETIKMAQNTTRSTDFRDEMPDILNSVTKVKTAYLSYLKFFEK